VGEKRCVPESSPVSGADDPRGDVPALVRVLEASGAVSSEARRCAAAYLETLTFAAPLGEVMIVVSELVTNAAEHGEPPIRLRLSASSAGLRVEVADTSNIQPRVGPVDPSSPSGRGLQLVDALSSGWGTDPTPDGKTVWAMVEWNGATA